jgi:hypothetical protein
LTVAGGSNYLVIGDANGCSDTFLLDMPQPSPLAIAFGRVGVVRCNGDSVTVQVNATGGTPSYSGTGNFSVFAGISAFTVTDANGCTADTTLTLSEPNPLLVTLVSGDQSAPGINDGFVQVQSVTGGTAPYYYADLNGLSPGIYCITVQDNSGCRAEACDTVLAAGCTLTATVTDSIPIRCNGGQGYVFVSASGGQPTYSGTGLFSAAAGTNSYTVTDAAGCSTTVSITLSEPDPLSVDSVVLTNVSCYGSADGVIDISVSGGTFPYSYQWNDGPVTPDRTGLVPGGPYVVIVTDAAGCTSSRLAVVGQPDSLSIAATLANPSCFGASTGSIQLTVNGGTLPYDYQWSNGDNSSSADSLGAGAWSVVITDDNGCTKADTFSLVAPSALVLAAVETDIECYDASIGSIDLSVSGGIGPYSYSWDTPLNDTTQDVAFLPAGSYTVVVTDAFGCSASLTSQLLQPAGPLNIQFVVTGVSCGNAGSIDLTVSGGTGPYTYQWSDSSTTQDLSGLSVGNYSVTVTDDNACTRTESFTIPLLSDSLELTASVSNVRCFGGSDGSINLSVTGGSGFYTYSWSNGSTTQDLSNLGAGRYAVSVADSAGCIAADSFVVTAPSLPLSLSISANSVSCASPNSGVVDLSVNGGTPGYTYSWSNGAQTQDLSGLTAGTYRVLVTDANGCTLRDSAVIRNPSSSLSVSYVSSDPTCFGASNGSIAVTASGATGPVTYTWNYGATTSSVTGLSAGNYSVTLADSLGCSITQPVTLTAPSALVLSATVGNVTCFNGANGFINLSVTGGTPGYSYSWSNGRFTEDVFVLTSGSYSVIVTDANGCTASSAYTVSQPPASLVLNLTTVPVRCNGGSDGAVQLQVTGGLSPYSYLWSTGSTSAGITGLSAGQYSVSVRDSAGCFQTAIVQVTQSDSISIVLDSLRGDVCGGTSGGVFVSVYGGNSPYLYSWSNGAIGQDLTGVGGGSYVLTVTDASGCTRSRIFTVSSSNPLLLTETHTDVLCFGASTGSVNLSVTGGSPAYSFLWSPGGRTSEDLSGIAAGNYSVRVTDANGCTASLPVTILQSADLQLSANITPVTCFGSNTGVVDLNVSGGGGGYSYLWSNGSTLQDLSQVPAGTYSVNVTDAYGCSDSLRVTVGQSAASITITYQTVAANCGPTGSIDISVFGGNGAFTYSWSNGSTTQDITGLYAGTYIITVTDGSGCTRSASIAVSGNGNSPVISANVVLNRCFGESNGSISLNVSGGTGPYSFLWSNNATTQNISQLPNGVYAVTVSDNNGCNAVFSTQITSPSQLLVNGVVTDVICFGDTSGRIDLSVSGGVSPYYYQWTNGSTAQDLISLSSGVYTVTVSDGAACSVTRTYTVTGPSAAISTVVVSRPVTCFGASNGSVTVSVSGGIPPYSYQWSNGSTLRDLSNVGAGTYVLNIRDSLGCQRSVTVVVTQPAALNIASLVRNVTCNGTSNGSIDLTVSGGSAPYGYLWSPGGSVSEDRSNLAPGTYGVTVTDAFSCTATATFLITQPGLLNVSANVTGVACYGDSTGSIDVSVAGGVSPYSYVWSNGRTTQDLTQLRAGTYTVTVTDANGCTASRTYVVQQPVSSVLLSATAFNIRCPGGQDGSINLFVAGGTPPYTYLWNTGATTLSLTGLPAGGYTAVATDSRGCTGTYTVFLTQPSAFAFSSVVTNVSCNGGSNGAIDLTLTGGVPGYSYSWSPGGYTSADIQQLTAGTYTVSILDSRACTASYSVTVTQPAALTLSFTKTDVVCNGASTGRIDLSVGGGSAPYSYLWSNGSTVQDPSALPAGTYSVTVTDSKGCTATTSVTILQPQNPLTVVANVTSVTCNGGTNGSILLTVSGGTPGYSYLWSDGATTQNRTGLTAGNYSVTVRDSRGCTFSVSSAVNQPPALVVNVAVTNVSCPGGSNGSVSLTASGGTAPYSYQWTPPYVNLPVRTNLTAGTYSCIVTDAVGCSISRTAVVTEPRNFNLVFAVTMVSCYGGANGAIDATMSGGTPPYVYSWSNGSTDADQDSLPAGTYQLTVTDSNGCSFGAGTVILQPTAPLSVTTGVTDVLCNGAATGIITASVTGGTPGYRYSWSSGQTTQSVSGITAGIYTLTVTDNNFCVVQRTDTVEQPASPLAVSSVVQPVSCNGLSDGSVDLTVSGGTAPYSYRWTGIVSSQEDLAGLAAGTYGYTVTDANGCSASGTVVVLQPSRLVLSANVSPVRCFGELTGSIDLSVSGGNGPYDYLWSIGNSTQDLVNIPTGTYSVLVSDASGCTASATYSVIQPASPLGVSAVVSNAGCFGTATGSVDVTVNGGSSPYSYLWNTGATSQDLLGIVAGTYSSTVTDAFGCSASVSATILQQDPLQLSFSVTNVSCFGQSDGSVNLNVAATYPPFSFAWSNGNTQQDLNGLAAGTYTVTVTDATGCTSTGSAVVAQPAALQLSASVVDAACNGGSTGSVNLSVTGGTSPFTYLWSNGASTQDIFGIPAGLYELTILDSNQCAASLTVRVGEGSQIQTVITGSSAYCNVPGVITASATGGTGAYTYQWSSGQTTSVISHTSGGTFRVTVTDLNGCSVTDSITVQRVSSPPDAAGPIAGPTVVCHNTNIVYSVPPVPGATAYQWTLPNRSTGWSNTNTISVVFQGSFQSGVICVSALNGCGAGAAACINVVLSHNRPQAPASITGTQYPCAPGTYTYTVSPLGNASGYDWIISGTGATIVSGNGTGTVVVATSAGFTGGVLSVAGTNCNGTGQYTDLVLYGTPVVGASLTGPVSPCPGATHNYSIADVPGAVSYTWSITGNAVITSSNGRSCTVRFNNNWSGGILTVAVSNPCGTTVQSFPLTGAPPAPASITGPVSGLCVTTTAGSVYASYTCTPVPGATVYNWSLPRGMTIVANNGNSIVVEVRKQFTSGSVCVSVGNGCSTSASTCLFVTSVPSAPVVSGPANACLSTFGIPYSVTPVVGAVSYQWSASSGALLSASGSSATVDFRNTVGSTVVVTASVANGCGTGPSGSISVLVNRACRSAASPVSAAVYPNPASRTLKVRSSCRSGEKYDLTVSDLSGRVLISEQLVPESEEFERALPVDGLSPGLYLVRITGTTPEETQVLRFVKE